MLPYATWPLVDGIDVDGWRFGTAMRYVGKSWGDAFVESPDGSRVGIVWVVGTGSIERLVPPTVVRHGVYRVPFAREMHDTCDLFANFKEIPGPLRQLLDAGVSSSMSDQAGSPSSS